MNPNSKSERMNYVLMIIVTLCLLIVSTLFSMKGQVKTNYSFLFDAKKSQLTIKIDENQPARIVENVIVDGVSNRVEKYWFSSSMQKLSTVTMRNTFLEGEHVLYQSINRTVTIIDEQGATYNVTFKPRPFYDYSVSFWLHRLFSAILMFFSLWVYRLSPSARGARIAVTGSYALAVGYLIATSSFDRLWAIDPDILYWNFVASRFLVVVFSASVFALAWILPRPLSHQVALKYLPHMVFILLCGLLILGYTDYIENVNLTYIYPYTFVIVLSIFILIVKAIRARKHIQQYLLDWISLRWVIASAAIGVIFPLLYNFLWDIGMVKSINPVLANAPAIVFKLGLSALVVREKLYQLEAMWWQVWVLLLAIASFISLTFMCHVMGIPTDFFTYLIITLISILIAFSTQLLVAKKYLVNMSSVIEKLTPKLMSLNANRRTVLEYREEWKSILDFAFKPFQIIFIHHRFDGDENESVAIAKEGTSLLVRDLRHEGYFELMGASFGMRLFSEKDAKLARFFYQTANLNLTYKEAHKQGENRERKRIAADLHDDIGGKLLYLSSAEGRYGLYARETLEDLRTLTRGLSSEDKTLEELIADLTFSLSERCDVENIAFKMSTKLDGYEGVIIPASSGSVFTSLLSELVRNGMQHHEVEIIQVDIDIVNDELTLTVTNDGQFTEPTHWKSGLGLVSMNRRVNDLKGEIHWTSIQAGGVSCTARWPIKNWISS